MIRPRSVVIGTPVGGSFTVPFYGSMVNLVATEYAKPDTILACQPMYSAGLYVTINRNNLAQRFLAIPQADWLLMIDSDIEFAPTIAHEMIDRADMSSATIVAANLPLGDGLETTAYDKVVDFRWRQAQNLPALDTFKVDAAATAVMLIHRRVFGDIDKNAKRNSAFDNGKLVGQGFGSWFDVERWMHKDGVCEPIGEDLAFCEKAKNAGHKTWIARNLSHVRHYKSRLLAEGDKK